MSKEEGFALYRFMVASEGAIPHLPAESCLVAEWPLQQT